MRRGRPFGKSVGSKQAGHGKGHVIDHTKLHGKNKASGIFCAHLSSTWHVQERRVEKCIKTISERAFTYYIKQFHKSLPGCATFYSFQGQVYLLTVNKGPIFSEKYWYCPKNVLCSIQSLCFELSRPWTQQCS